MNKDTLTEILRTNNTRDAEIILEKLVCPQPIKTAPKDGTEILAIQEGGHFIARWVETMIKRGWADSYPQEDDFFWINPTHWMPLPEPPKPKKPTKHDIHVIIANAAGYHNSKPGIEELEAIQEAVEKIWKLIP